jgi:hypothetical protein
MRSRRRHPRATLALALLQLVLGLGAAADLVLCREASGAVAVESAFAGDCCPDHGVVPPAFGTASCECLDTPLLASAIEPRSGRPVLELAPPMAVAAPAPRRPDVGPALAALLDHRVRAAPSRATLASIVLVL